MPTLLESTLARGSSTGPAGILRALDPKLKGIVIAAVGLGLLAGILGIAPLLSAFSPILAPLGYLTIPCVCLSLLLSAAAGAWAVSLAQDVTEGSVNAAFSGAIAGMLQALFFSMTRVFADLGILLYGTLLGGEGGSYAIRGISGAANEIVFTFLVTIVLSILLGAVGGMAFYSQMVKKAMRGPPPRPKPADVRSIDRIG